jgi:hypothetical protein
MNSETKIEALFILEILGRPPEHLKETLNEIVGKMEEEPFLEIKNKKIHEPKEVEGKGELYTSFAEIEVELEDATGLIRVLFKYMPSHIQIISPENIKFSNGELTEFLNEISRKIHNYDGVARTMQLQMSQMQSKFNEILEEKEKLKKQPKKKSSTKKRK